MKKTPSNNKQEIGKDKNLFENKEANEDISEINIIYDINKDDKTINIFGYEFVENNKNICKMIIDNKEYEISKNIM